MNPDPIAQFRTPPLDPNDRTTEQMYASIAQQTKARATLCEMCKGSRHYFSKPCPQCTAPVEQAKPIKLTCNQLIRLLCIYRGADMEFTLRSVDRTADLVRLQGQGLVKQADERVNGIMRRVWVPTEFGSVYVRRLLAGEF